MIAQGATFQPHNKVLGRSVYDLTSRAPLQGGSAGLAVVSGYSQSLQAAQGGLVLSVDTAVTALAVEVPLIEWMEQVRPPVACRAARLSAAQAGAA